MSVDARAAIRQFVVDNFLFGRTDAMPADGESLQSKGVVDSTGVLELVEFLEREFGIQVDDADLVPANLDSVEQLAAFVARKRSA